MKKQVVEILQDYGQYEKGNTVTVENYIKDNEFYKSVSDFYYDIFVRFKENGKVSKVDFIEMSAEGKFYEQISEKEYQDERNQIDIQNKKLQELNEFYIKAIQGKSFSEVSNLETKMQSLERFIVSQSDAKVLQDLDIAKELSE